MGIVQKPSNEDYWSRSVLFGTPGIPELMSHDHFKQIRAALRFSNEKKRQKALKMLYKKFVL